MGRFLVTWVVLAATSAAAAPSDIPVTVYADGNKSSLTDLVQGLDLKDGPLPGVPVDLLGGGGRLQTSTGSEGRALFEGLNDGFYLVRPLVDGDPVCTSRNTAAHLAGLLAEGTAEAVYVALGDSTPVYGAARPYPQRLGDKVKALFPQAEVHNLAHEGSTTWDWLPGHWAFEGARAWIAQADLITVSLGGNDLQELAGLDFTDLTAALEAAKKVIEQTLDNAALIVSAIRAENPHADIVWTVYPNYARSRKWLDYVPEAYIGVVQTGFEIAIGMMREGLAENAGLLIADIAEEWADKDIEPYMHDPIHVNDLGAESYAKILFRTLGGVLLPEDDGRERLFGYAMPVPVSDHGGPEPVTEDVPDAAFDAGGPEDPAGDAAPEAGVEAVPDDAGSAEVVAEGAAPDPATAGDEVQDLPSSDAGSMPDAVAADPGPPPAGSSGGGCQAGGTQGPGATWPFLFALLGLRRRRP